MDGDGAGFVVNGWGCCVGRWKEGVDGILLRRTVRRLRVISGFRRRNVIRGSCRAGLMEEDGLVVESCVEERSKAVEPKIERIGSLRIPRTVIRALLVLAGWLMWRGLGIRMARAQLGPRGVLGVGVKSQSHELVGRTTKTFAQAFSIVFLSQFGDKSMFATALMAMKYQGRTVLIGAFLALSVMTLIACFLGKLLHLLPVQITYYSSIALFSLFGFQMLMHARKLSGPSKSAESERDDAAAMVERLRPDEKSWSVLGRIFSLIFVAEWMDRSMLATMALASSNGTGPVIVGATLANIVCTSLAVLGATLVASKISERVVSLIAGLLFEVFAVVTFLEGPGN